jgi:flagellar hook-associated protein 3 FlgL
MTSSIGTLANLTDTLNNISQVQNKLSDLQTEVSSGLKATTFQGLNGQVEQYTQLNAQVSRTTQYQTDNTVTIGKLQTADNALASMETIANSMESLMTSAQSSTLDTDTSGFQQQMQDMMNSMAAQLNTTYANNYIFSGTAATTEPVPNALAANSTIGVPDANYYQGSTSPIIIRADDQNTTTFPVSANDTAFQQIFAAAQQAIAAFNNHDSTGLQAAQTLIAKGQDNLDAARTRIDSTSTDITATNTQLASLSTYWQGVTGDVANTDIVSTTTQISNYEAVLQATFQIYARISQLNLSDYLK